MISTRIKELEAVMHLIESEEDHGLVGTYRTQWGAHLYDANAAIEKAIEHLRAAEQAEKAFSDFRAAMVG